MPVIQGSELADVLVGSLEDDEIYGGGGNDTLDGLSGNDHLDGGAGTDDMIGGAGDDDFVVDVYVGDQVIVRDLLGNQYDGIVIDLLGDEVQVEVNVAGVLQIMTVPVAQVQSSDEVIENAGEGYDRVLAGATYTLPANVETLVLTGAQAIDGTGNSQSNLIIGNDVRNRLYGLDGDDTLTGGGGRDDLYGGAGADTMTGGTGNDVYYVNDPGDVVTEAAGEGIDAVRSSISFVLGANFERLMLTGHDAIDGTGNALWNTIRGNDAANTLDGGDGNDQLYGNAGNDTLVGGAGLDQLRGGLGADTMIGGTANDKYFVNDPGDLVIEAAREGSDVVKASISYTLPDHVEGLTLQGSNPIDGTGNAMANRIAGNGADNALHGGDGHDQLFGMLGNDRVNGGYGNDVLDGGRGSDTFVFDAALNRYYNVDKITDFTVGADTIELDQSVFSALGLGTLAAEAFATGTAAQDADDRIIYDSSTGKLYYDSNGNAAGGQVLFAQVTAGTALTNADFLVVG